MPKDLDTSVNEDFIKQFPYGERFTDEDGVPATRTKTPDVALRFKPKDYEKTVTRKINYRVERTGATVSRIYQTIRYYGTYEFEKGTPEVLEVAEAEVPVVSEKGTQEGHEVKDFEGGVIPNEAPKVEIPTYDNGTVPNDAPIHEVPEYKAPLGSVPNEAPKFELPEFKGGVVPNDAPILEKPEYKIPTVSEEPKQPVVPVVEIPQPQPQAPQQQFVAKELPNTGTSDSDKLVALSGVGLLGLLGFSFKKRKED